MIQVTDDIVISDDDVTLRYSRSGGPGGQNVNKVNTRVTLLFNVTGCAGMTDEQKGRVLKRLSGRLSRDGLISVVSRRYRTQQANRRWAEQRLAELLRDALKDQPIRKPTAIPYSAKRKRVEHKRRRGKIKKYRRTPSPDKSDY